MSKRFILLAIILATTAGPALGQQAERPAYLNPALPIDQRVDDLAARMTLDEKASQFSSTSAAIPRLQVPAYNWWSEALHGVASQGIATVFPQAIGLGATFNTPLIHQIAVTISTEARAKYHEYERKGQAGGAAAALPGSGMGIRPGPAGLTYWSPNVNIFRDPRWGRGQETYGEDPFLTGMLGTAFVKGLQGDDPKYFKTIATPKHFAVHSGPEPSRHVFDAKVSLHDMEDTYLPAFRQTVVEGKAYSVMCAYNRINGEPACASTFLLGDTLRDAWKFNGYVVSDCGAIQDINRNHKFVKNIEDSAAVSLKRGTDLDCGADTQGYATAMQQGPDHPGRCRHQPEADPQGPLRDGHVRPGRHGALHEDPVRRERQRRQPRTRPARRPRVDGPAEERRPAPLQVLAEDDRDRRAAGRLDPGARRQLQRHVVEVRHAGGRHPRPVPDGHRDLRGRHEVPAQSGDDSGHGLSDRGRQTRSDGRVLHQHGRSPAPRRPRGSRRSWGPRQEPGSSAARTGCRTPWARATTPPAGRARSRPKTAAFTSSRSAEPAPSRCGSTASS